MLILRAKYLSETAVLPRAGFDFTSGLQSGETLISATTTATVYSGTDPGPGSIVDGPPIISGSVVTQLFTAGIVGVIYKIAVKVVTSLSQILEKEAYLAVISD